MKKIEFDNDLKTLPHIFVNLQVLILKVLESGFYGTLIWEY